VEGLEYKRHGPYKSFAVPEIGSDQLGFGIVHCLSSSHTHSFQGSIIVHHHHEPQDIHLPFGGFAAGWPQLRLDAPFIFGLQSRVG
jgi:hypothetical protein